MRLDMLSRPLRSCLSVAAIACALAACTSKPPGADDMGYALLPATIFSTPDTSNVFFARAGLSGPGEPFVFNTDPGNGHVASGCTGTTAFDGADMIVDWACTGGTRTWTISGTLTWDGEQYYGDCTTSFTGPTFSFANLVVPFRGLQ